MCDKIVLVNVKIYMIKRKISEIIDIDELWFYGVFMY